VVVSTTAMSASSASGFCLASLFDDWPSSQLLEITIAGSSPEFASRAGISISCPSGVLGDADVVAIDSFSPQVVYVRANEWPESWWDLGRTLAARFDIPYVAHVFDDVVAWQLARFNPPLNELRAIRRDVSLRRLLGDAVATFSCSDAHTESMLARYGVIATPFVRWVEPIVVTRLDHGEVFRFAYAGRCNSVQHSEALRDVAFAALALADEGVAIAIDCIGPNADDFHTFFARHPETKAVVTFHGNLAARADQLEFLFSRDATLVTLNFDADSIGYVGRATSSKALDALAGDRPTLVYGPTEMETVAWAARTGWADVASDPSALTATLRAVVARGTLTDAQHEARTRERARWSRATVLEAFVKQMRMAAGDRQST
jgi:glycosyltransferase involved in cell wall biosynthesis